MDIRKLKENPIGVAIGVVLTIIMVVCISLAFKSSPGYQCQFMDTKSTPGSANQVAASDFTALANFSGYLYVVQGIKQHYLPLKLIGLSVEGDQTEPILNLWTDHAKLKIVGRLNSAKVYDYHVIDVTLNETCVESLPGLHKQCSIASANFHHSISESYKCTDTTPLVCQFSPFTTLVIDSISFEIYGDPRMIKRGEFSKPPEVVDNLINKLKRAS